MNINYKGITLESIIATAEELDHKYRDAPLRLKVNSIDWELIKSVLPARTAPRLPRLVDLSGLPVFIDDSLPSNEGRLVFRDREETIVLRSRP